LHSTVENNTIPKVRVRVRVKVSRVRFRIMAGRHRISRVIWLVSVGLGVGPSECVPQSFCRNVFLRLMHIQDMSLQE